MFFSLVIRQQPPQEIWFGFLVAANAQTVTVSFGSILIGPGSDLVFKLGHCRRPIEFFSILNRARLKFMSELEPFLHTHGRTLAPLLR